MRTTARLLASTCYVGRLAVLNTVLAANPVRDVQLIRSTPTGAEALTTDQLREPQIKLRVSETCAKS